MTEAIALGVLIGALAVLTSGIRRLAWRYRALLGVGFAVVFAALRLAMTGGDPGLLVLIGAFGGALATVGSERGERDRERRSAAILGGSSALPATSSSNRP